MTLMHLKRETYETRAGESGGRDISINERGKIEKKKKN